MVRTSKRDPEVLAEISLLLKHPGFLHLVEEVKEAREKYFLNLAKHLLASPNPVDQREIDVKKGFWRGALWALSVFPNQAGTEYEKYVELALKESEELVRSPY